MPPPELTSSRSTGARIMKPSGWQVIPKAWGGGADPELSLVEEPVLSAFSSILLLSPVSHLTFSGPEAKNHPDPSLSFPCPPNFANTQ